MLISDSHRAVFVHVQKTGGVTVQAMMEQAWPDARRHAPRARHRTYAEILRREPALADYFSFAFVRNPWSRMVSWWEMILDIHHRAGEGHEDALRHLRTNDFIDRTGRDYGSFDEFVLRGPRTWERLSRPQVDYLRAPGRSVDFVGRTEQLDSDIAEVCRRLGMAAPPEVPRRNETQKSRHWRDYYTDETRQRVGELFRADLEEFGYTFDPVRAG